MCCFGLTVDPEGKLSRGRTRLLTNDPIVVELFRQYQCSGDHEHLVLEGQAMTRKAQISPPAFCKHMAET
eukprot:1187949-Pyramimonas_sp.AAC.1